ncbi:hypothetical protein QTP88_021068 [Uroleucon formosanum]
MDKFIFKCNKNEDLKNTSNIALQNNESNNEVLNKQIFGDADNPVNEIPISRLEKKDRIDKGPYQPKFDFPRTIIGSKYRSFQIEWYNKYYNKYSWLEYSKVLDSAFCFYCRVFCLNDPATKGHIDFAFIKKGFKNWHRANECFRNHEKSKGHQHSVSSWSGYTKDKSIDMLGHDESKISIAQGLFLDLVDLVSKYDPTLKDHLTNGPQNALYTSGKIQNDIIISISNITS